MSSAFVKDLIRIAENGTAPESHCLDLQTGFDDAIERLARTYIGGSFRSGSSSIKFVIGPYGSGKTHFVRTLMEQARRLRCVTSEVQLSKEVDFSRGPDVYKEIARELAVPNAARRGIRELLTRYLESAQAEGKGDPIIGDRLARARIEFIAAQDLELAEFGRILRVALEAQLSNNVQTETAAISWLEGDIANREIAKILETSVVTASEANTFSNRMLNSLFQFIKIAGYRGTIVVFDEAEQGLSVSAKHFQRIQSIFQSKINATADLRNGSALLVFAVTPDVIERMADFGALQQRIADPGPDNGFFDGNTYAVKIDLTRRSFSESNLAEMGKKYINAAYDDPDWESTESRETLLAQIDAIAREVAMEDATSSSRRAMARRTAELLMRSRNDEGEFGEGPLSEFEDEV